MKRCNNCGGFYEGEHRCDAPNVSNKDNMSNKSVSNKKSSTYRYRDPDKHRAYQRELMRRRRAKAKIGK